MTCIDVLTLMLHSARTNRTLSANIFAKRFFRKSNLTLSGTTQNYNFIGLVKAEGEGSFNKKSTAFLPRHIIFSRPKQAFLKLRFFPTAIDGLLLNRLLLN